MTKFSFFSSLLDKMVVTKWNKTRSEKNLNTPTIFLDGFYRRKKEKTKFINKIEFEGIKIFLN